VLRRQHHPGIRRPGGRLDPAPAPAAGPGRQLPVGDASFPAHAIFNLGISGDTAESLAGRLEQEAQPRQLGEQTIVVIAVGVNQTAFELEL
jgi:hypothetical protein